MVTVFYLLHAFGFRSGAWVWLTVSSLFFYAYWNKAYCLLIIFSMAVNLIFVRQIRRAVAARRSHKIYIYLAVAFNVGLIVYFKYRGLIVNSVGELFGFSWPEVAVFIPLGISFYTFQELAFVVDTPNPHTRKINLWNYPVFVTFFPHLIAGPIVLHSQFFDQILDFRWKEKFFDKIGVGLSLFIVGLFKKIILADTVGAVARDFFDYSGPASFFHAWEGSLAYTFQLYFDFSGYSDMAIGLAAIFGFAIPQNFNSPYKACNIRDFWGRWHMTLSNFLKTHLYIPLGGNRGSRARTAVNVMVTMTIGGIWHGANWTFLVWGVYHGLLIAVSSAFDTGKAGGYFRLRLAQLLTFICVVVGWVIFRSHDFAQARSALAGMAGLGDMGEPNPIHWLLLIGLFAVTSFAPNSTEWFAACSRFKLPMADSCRPVKWTPNIAVGVLLGVLAVICVLRISLRSEFLYFQF